MIRQMREQLAGYDIVDHPEFDRFEAQPREAAVLIPVTRNNCHPHLILTRRADHLNSHSGEVAFPGGMRDQADHSLEVTALRESHEEVDLNPHDVEVIRSLRPLITRYGVKVTPYVGLVPEDVQLTANPDELDSIFHVPIEFFLRDERSRSDSVELNRGTIHVPCYEYEGYQIWGVTALIIVEFVNAAFSAGIDLWRAPGDDAR